MDIVSYGEGIRRNSDKYARIIASTVAADMIWDNVKKMLNEEGILSIQKVNSRYLLFYCVNNIDQIEKTAKYIRSKVRTVRLMNVKNKAGRILCRL